MKAVELAEKRISDIPEAQPPAGPPEAANAEMATDGANAGDVASAGRRTDSLILNIPESREDWGLGSAVEVLSLRDNRWYAGVVIAIE